MNYVVKLLLLAHKLLLRLSMKTFCLAWGLNPTLVTTRTSLAKTSATKKTEELLEKSLSESNRIPRYRVSEKKKSDKSSEASPPHHHSKQNYPDTSRHNLSLSTGRGLRAYIGNGKGENPPHQNTLTIRMSLHELELALNYLADPVQVYPPKELEYLKPEEWQAVHHLYLNLLEEQRVSNVH
jgi:hypothetical protein